MDVFDEEFEAVWKLKRPLVPKLTQPPARSAKFKQFMEQYGNKNKDKDDVDDGSISISTNVNSGSRIRSRL